MTVTKPQFSRPSTRRLRSKRGLTLIEVLITIALLGVLMGIVIVPVANSLDRGNEDGAKAFVTTALKTPLTQYRIHMGRYPSTAEGIQALITAPEGDNGRWRGPYLDTNRIPEDPWGNPYQYRFPGERGVVDIFSFGADGESGGEGLNADIGNWREDEE